MKRIIGIVHRVKFTAEGEARPTMVVIIGDGKVKTYELATEQDELDFVLGHFPTGYRKVIEGEDLSKVREQHLICDEKTKTPKQIPSGYDGFTSGDTVGMTLGGSGDYLAFAFAKQAQIIGASIVRITPFALKAERGDAKKDGDAALLAKLVSEKPTLFTKVSLRDMATTRICIAFRVLVEGMKARIAADQRHRQAFIGRLFCKEDGMLPETALEKAYNDDKGTDEILLNLKKAEGRAERELEKLLKKSDVYNTVFAPIEGAGPRLAARLMSVIQDIRRFKTPGALRSYCGIRCDAKTGKLVKRTRGATANWCDEARKACYLFADQANKRADSHFGKRFREIKANYRVKYPEKVKIEGGKGHNYTDGHIHKMACWVLADEFLTHIWTEWTKLENGGVPKVEETTKSATT